MPGIILRIKNLLNKGNVYILTKFNVAMQNRQVKIVPGAQFS